MINWFEVCKYLEAYLGVSNVKYEDGVISYSEFEFALYDTEYGALMGNAPQLATPRPHLYDRNDHTTYKAMSNDEFLSLIEYRPR